MATRIAHLREATIVPTLSLPAAELSYLMAKRIVDFVLALAMLIVFAPLMLLVAVLVRLDSPGPVIYRQERVRGNQEFDAQLPDKRVFEFYKFRTMYHKADERIHRDYVSKFIRGSVCASDHSGGQLYKVTRDPRVTHVGRILRQMSIDELPQLVNILRGEMSFVGPRPAIPYEVQQYKPWHLYRLSVAQGLTGLWQVMGRNELSFDEMVQLDIEYARRRSLLLDIKIILATVPAVLTGRGVC